jgi:hypothetical protein
MKNKQTRKQLERFCKLLFLINELDPKMPLKISVERVQKLLSPAIFDFPETHYSMDAFKKKMFNNG